MLGKIISVREGTDESAFSYRQAPDDSQQDFYQSSPAQPKSRQVRFVFLLNTAKGLYPEYVTKH